jgi:hypothetical protein
MTASRERDLASWRSAIEKELHPGEKVRWAGLPSPHVAIRGGWWALVFGIGFAAIPLFMLGTALGMVGSDKGQQNHFGFFFVLFLVPFLGIGLWQAATPLRNYLRAANSVHVVTSERVMTLVGGRWGKAQSFYPKDIKGLDRRDLADGRATLRLDRGLHSNGEGYQQVYDDWYGLADARGAETAVRDLLRAV